MKHRKLIIRSVCVLLLCTLLSGCEAAAFEFTHEKAASIQKERAIFPSYADESSNQGIAVHGGYYIDATDMLRVYALREAIAANPVPQLEMPIGQYRSAVFCGKHMLLDSKDTPLLYVDLSGAAAPVALAGHRLSEYAAEETVQSVLAADAAYVLYSRGTDAAQPRTYTVEYIDLATNQAVDILTVSGTKKQGTVITELDEHLGNLMVYGYEDGNWFLREYSKEGTLLGEHTPYPSCAQSEIDLLGQVIDMEWMDGYLYVFREDGVQVYALDADGFYQPVTFAANDAQYIGSSDGYCWFWNYLSRTLYTLNRQTGEFRSFRLDLAGEKIFAATKTELLHDDSGVVLVRCDDSESATKNRLYMFDISEELFK